MSAQGEYACGGRDPHGFLRGLCEHQTSPYANDMALNMNAISDQCLNLNLTLVKKGIVYEKATDIGTSIIGILGVVGSDFTTFLIREETQENNVQAEYDTITQKCGCENN